MPLTAGKRDEENERFKNTLQRLVALDYLPENFSRIDEELIVFGLSLETLVSTDSFRLLEHLSAQKIDFENAERFADFLVVPFPALAKSLYEHIQQNSVVFSLAIFNKIAAIK